MTGDITIELVAPDGRALADVSRLASGRKWTRTRNNSDDIEFTLSLDAWEAYCRKLGVHPRELLRKRWTEVRLKERETYLAGGFIVGLNTPLKDGTIKVRVFGYLDWFKKRRTAPLREFGATEGTDIAWTLIAESQAQPRGNLYITRGPNQATAGPHDRTYKRTVIKDGLQALTAVQMNPFDIEFTPLKQFNTYLNLGSNRPDIVFKWGVNILDATVDEDVADITNHLVALGSGFGDDAQAQVEIENETSEDDYGLAEDVITESADDNSQGGLDSAARSYLDAWSTPIVLIDLVVDGGKRPYVTDYGLGDYVYVDLTGHLWLDGYVGMFRIQQQSCQISDDGQKTVTLTVSA